MARGRSAENPTEIPSSGWKDVIMRVKEDVEKDRIGLIAAGIAFYGLLALFPGITAVLAIAGVFAEPQQITGQLNFLQGVIPDQVTEIITKQAMEVAGSRKGGLGLAAFVGLAVALYSASKGTASLMEGINTAYGEDETRGFAAKLATRIGLTTFIILGICTALGVTLAVPAVTGMFDAGPALEALGSLLAYLMLFGLAAFALAIIYRYAPSRDNPVFAWVSVGSLVACSAWVLASAGFAFYVKHFGSYNETFGALGGVIVLLMWFWISAFIVLLGAELNAEGEAQTRRDTTVGRKQPMGQRNAVKADKLGKTSTA